MLLAEFRPLKKPLWGSPGEAGGGVLPMVGADYGPDRASLDAHSASLRRFSPNNIAVATAQICPRYGEVGCEKGQSFNIVASP